MKNRASSDGCATQLGKAAMSRSSKAENKINDA
jgi:hypothetical protein